MKVGFSAMALDTIAGGMDPLKMDHNDKMELRRALEGIKDAIATGEELEGLCIIRHWDDPGEPVVMTAEEGETFKRSGWHPGINHLDLEEFIEKMARPWKSPKPNKGR